jgi:hypothetical protein
MKASDLEKRGADEIYEKFMEMKDYDGDGRLQAVITYFNHHMANKRTLKLLIS